MLEYIESLISQVDPMLAYFILFVSAYEENTFPPVPGDTVTVIGAYLITTGKLSFTGVWLSTTFGSVLGFMTMFYIYFAVKASTAPVADPLISNGERI